MPFKHFKHPTSEEGLRKIRGLWCLWMPCWLWEALRSCRRQPMTPKVLGPHSRTICHRCKMYLNIMSLCTYAKSISCIVNMCYLIIIYYNLLLAFTYYNILCVFSNTDPTHYAFRHISTSSRPSWPHCQASSALIGIPAASRRARARKETWRPMGRMRTQGENPWMPRNAHPIEKLI